MKVSTRPAPALTAVSLLLLLLSVFHIANLPPAAAWALLLVAGLSFWRPDLGLLLVAAVLPISGWVGLMWTPADVQWPNALMVAFGAGYFAYVAGRDDAPADRTLRARTLTMAALVGASLVVQLAVFMERLGGQDFRAQLWRIASRDVLMVNGSFYPVAAAALLFEGLMLFYAAGRLAQASPGFRPAALRAVVAGATAAAAINLWELVGKARRGDAVVTTFLRLLRTERTNVHYQDMNAAGSYFVLALSIAVTLALARRNRAWGAAAAVVAAGLWMTNSRTAVLAGVLATALPLLARLRRHLARRLWLPTALAVAALAVAAAGAAMLMPARGLQQSASSALQVRTGLARTALRMIVARPAFGIGIGEFYQRSGEFSSPDLLALFPVARNENAHNNFLQVFAELGIAGFAAFMWILLLAGRRLASALPALRPPEQEPGGDRLAWGVASGLAAFVLTCLAGHPLLIAEVSGTFWLVLGVAAGWGGPEARRTAPGGRTPGRVALALLVVLALTVPIRARQQRAVSNLDHVGIGLSGWQHSDDNVTYRIAGARSTVFVPAETSGVMVPLRAAHPGGALDIELRLDGRVANVVHAEGDRWTRAVILMPSSRGGPRFRRLDLRVTRGGPASPERTLLLVGKVVPR